MVRTLATLLDFMDFRGFSWLFVAFSWIFVFFSCFFVLFRASFVLVSCFFVFSCLLSSTFVSSRKFKSPLCDCKGTSHQIVAVYSLRIGFRNVKKGAATTSPLQRDPTETSTLQVFRAIYYVVQFDKDERESSNFAKLQHICIISS